MIGASVDDDSDSHLPPQLLQAPRAFAAWAQKQLLADQKKSTPTTALYHYTSEASFRGILSTERLWCFNHRHQSDRTEFEFSLKIARQVIKDTGRTKNGVVRHFCACLDDLLNSNSFNDAFEFYLFSLSRHRDDASQWEQYGDRGRGFAIGFAPALFYANQSELNEQANENAFVGNVSYGEAAARDRHRRAIQQAARITDRVARANPDLVRELKPSLYLVTMARHVIASQLIWNCLTSKHMSFKKEQEVRYVLMNMREKFDAHRKAFGEKSYVEYRLPLRSLHAITEILVGPRAVTSAEAIATQFLLDQGYNANIPVHRSGIVA